MADNVFQITAIRILCIPDPIQKRLPATKRWTAGLVLAVIALAVFPFAEQLVAQTDLTTGPSANDSRSANTSTEEPVVGSRPNVGIEISDKAKTLGFDLKKLASIDRKFSQKIKSQEVVGCSALIYKAGEIAYYGHWGFQNARQAQPLARDTIFRIYSMSKPVTSIAAMQLVEQGKLDLDAPVSNYLTEFAELTVLEDKRGATPVVAKRTMTIRDLMRHTSGLTYGFFGNTNVDQQYRKSGVLLTDLDLSSTVTKLSKIPLLLHPGTQFHYGASTDVLGRVIEVVSKQPLDQYLKDNIFTPLNMDDTFFTVPEDKQARFAELYTPDGQGQLTAANPLQSIRYNNQANKFYSGGGGLCSTINDYLAFSKMLLNEGNGNEHQIVKPETLEQMITNQLVDIERPPGRQFKFGLGFRIFPEGDYGWGGAAGTRFWVNPEKNLAIVFMTQIMPYGRRNLGESFRETVYSSLR